VHALQNALGAARAVEHPCPFKPGRTGGHGWGGAARVHNDFGAH